MMSQTDIRNIFRGAFDTFKAFDNLTVESSGEDQNEFPTSVWQILNHLLIWQSYQINRLHRTPPEKHISEVDTWISERVPASKAILDERVEEFKKQLEAIEIAVNHLLASGPELAGKLTIIRELALHLSFHLGEVVLIRRLKRNYPMPHQMNAFLQT